MSRKQDLFVIYCKSIVFCLIAVVLTVIKPGVIQAQAKPAVCTSKPLMQRQITASYAQSSYIDCQIDPNLCKDMYTEPQTVTAKTEKVASASSKTAAIKTEKPKPSPSATPSPTVELTPSPVALPAQNGLSADKLFEMINAHRASKGLPAYEKDARLCELAQSRGPELHEEIYGAKYIHQGFKERNLPFWITENMISRDSEEVAMRWWLNSSLHRAGIESSKKYACGTCVGNSCAMLFTSWEPK